MQKIKIMCMLLCLTMVLLCGCAHVEVTADDVILELGMNPSDYKDSYVTVKDVDMDQLSFDFSKVDSQKVGKYEASVIYKKKKQNFFIEVRDTIAPCVKLKEAITVKTKEEIFAKDIIEELDERSGEVSVFFQEGENHSKTEVVTKNGVHFSDVSISYDVSGTYTNTLIIKDETGNQSSYSLIIQVEENEEEQIEDQDNTKEVSDAINAQSPSVHNSEETVAPVMEGDWVGSLAVAQRTNQLIVVAASGSRATVSMHIKNGDGSWTQTMMSNGFVGRDGVGQASEYAAFSPRGVWGIQRAFGSAANPGCSLSYIQVDSSYYWVDDVNSMYYNQFVTTNEVVCDWQSAENIVSVGAAYQYVLALDYNAACVPGAGSAFFLHCSTGRPTAGCVSVPTNVMVQIMQQIQPGCLIIIDTVQDVHNY